MLTNLLPGLRDLRTPLTTGYILVASIYVSFVTKIDFWTRTNHLGQQVDKLAKFAGAGPTLAAITFISFMVGALWSDIIPTAVQFIIWLLFVKVGLEIKYRYEARVQADLIKSVKTANTPSAVDDRTFSGKTYRGRLRTLALDSILKLWRSDEVFADIFRRHLGPYGLAPDEPEPSYSTIDRTIDVDRHIDDIIRDARNIPARLLGTEPDVWNTWDRLKSESEFRLAIATAVIPLAIALSVSQSQIWLTLATISIPLWLLGEQKGRRASGMLFESLIAGRVTTTPLENISKGQQLYWTRRIEPTEGLTSEAS